jgi:3-hydroxyacyl-CoA dehydrogenase
MGSRQAVRQVGCIGTGLIGRSWAVVFARAGCRVKLFDTEQSVAQQARSTVLAALPTADIELCSSLEQALSDTDFVQESVRERLDEKQDLYREMDALAGPATLFGSSTSIIPGSAFQSGLGISGRCLVVHPTNPPHLVPLTEICAGAHSSAHTTAAVHQLMLDVGQVPVLIHKELGGFVLNRLQCAVVKEALWLVETGVIEPMDLDLVMKRGLALRWVLMGPFETGHLNADGGYADYMRKYMHVFNEQFAEQQREQQVSLPVVDQVDAALRSAFPQGVRSRQAWRDGQLKALRGWLAEQAVSPTVEQAP